MFGMGLCELNGATVHLKSQFPYLLCTLIAVSY